MTLLTLTSNNVANPSTLDLSAYVDVQPGDGLDPSDPAFTQRVWSRSLLKEGATLALEQLVEREMQFPLRIGPVGGAANAPGSISATLKLIQQINEILETPGAIMTWQPPGASQATTFDVLSGMVESQYNYFAEGQGWEITNMRVFTMPLGRTASTRRYALASGVGPLLLITPYGSTGAQAITASSVGYGASPGKSYNGASGGVAYVGNPSLAGDAPALLQIDYLGPVSPSIPGAAEGGRAATPFVAVSMLPDQNYKPYIGAALFAEGLPTLTGKDAVGSVYCRTNASSGAAIGSQLPNQGGGYGFGNALVAAGVPPLSYAGQHRLLAVARASVLPQALTMLSNAAIPQATTATVYAGDWQLIDLGTYVARASETGQTLISTFGWSSAFPASNSVCADVTALYALPDFSTWFFNPQAFNNPSTLAQYSTAPMDGQELLLDDVLGDQNMYQNGASLPAGAPYTSYAIFPSVRPFARGLVPRPDPRNGMPVLAILGVGQAYQPSSFAGGGSEAWVNPQNQPVFAQVSVQERTRFMLP